MVWRRRRVPCCSPARGRPEVQVGTCPRVLCVSPTMTSEVHMHKESVDPPEERQRGQRRRPRPRYRVEGFGLTKTALISRSARWVLRR